MDVTGESVSLEWRDQKPEKNLKSSRDPVSTRRALCSYNILPVDLGSVVAHAGCLFLGARKTRFAALPFEQVHFVLLRQRPNMCDGRMQSQDSRFQGVTSRFLAKS